MFNNAHILTSLAARFESPERSPSPPHRAKIQTELCLPARLPTTGFIEREAEILAPREVIRQLIRTPSPETLSPTSDSESRRSLGSRRSSQASEPEDSPSSKRRASGIWSSLSSAVNATQKLGKNRAARPWKVEPYQIFAAVERHDIMFLMEVRDRDFELLLRKNGDATPLLHAMRIGHQDVAVVLLGAFSRYINNLGDEEMALPRTKTRLKALRTNLKLAIDFGLQKSQSDLIPSFLQTLIMSEGDKWVESQVVTIAGLLREGNAGKPVENAGNTVRKFATKQLGKADIIAALEDYVANATADLLMMAAWNCALDTIDGEPIPTYYFARDDRVYKAFTERLDRHKQAINKTCTRRLRWQMRVLRAVMEGRQTTYNRKVQTLAEEFDQGSGV
ncbi:hypothetical protein PsYK624_007660 [Phanerochaete sordida]|uniref:Uncharacterized protein n=1 Tax=Phanerochaete sordida TaxID=48140 RepID=A0A9P3FYV3_9APHY|nr:hypothetical protein PsYK624_007660 [Phanerochaete sordida]